MRNIQTAGHAHTGNSAVFNLQLWQFALVHDGMPDKDPLVH